VRILLVNQYYPPDGAATATVAAGAVATMTERHHSVTVVAGRPSYNVTERSPWRPWRTAGDGAAVVRRVGSSAFPRTRLPGRITNYLTYAAWSGPMATLARADVVVGMSDPPFASIVASLAAATRRRPFVYWLQDLHPEFPLATGDLRPGRAVDAWRTLHAGALRRAAAVVVLGDDMARRATAAGAAADKMHVIRSGADLRPAVPNGNGPAIAQAIRGDRDFVVVHAGNLGGTAAWEVLIRGVARLSGPENAGLVFVGDGAERAAAERGAAAWSPASAVRFFDYWPAADAQHVLAAGDLHAVTVPRGLEGLAVPSRIYGVMAAGRPILAVADERSDIAALVRRHECGVVADPDRPETVTAAVTWARSHPRELAAMGERARAAATEYDRRALLGQLVDVIESAAGPG
jgi:glycosyltransferase involved in cell wall biosynthesis